MCGVYRIRWHRGVSSPPQPAGASKKAAVESWTAQSALADALEHGLDRRADAGIEDDSQEVEVVEKGGGYYGIEVDGEEVESIQGKEAAEGYVKDNF